MNVVYMNEHEIVRLYTEEYRTLRMIAKMFDTDHHRIKRILKRHGVEITHKNRVREPFSDEHRRKIGEASKGRTSYWQGKKMPEYLVRKNMITHMKLDITLDDIAKYDDFDKLKYLTGGISRNIKHFNTKEKYLAYIDYFYSDEQFNKIYKKWIDSSKNKWYQPTLDHKVCKSKGGNWELSNLQFLTWFENRAKADMSEDEWNDIKARITGYFI